MKWARTPNKEHRGGCEFYNRQSSCHSAAILQQVRKHLRSDRDTCSHSQASLATGSQWCLLRPVLLPGPVCWQVWKQKQELNWRTGVFLRNESWKEPLLPNLQPPQTLKPLKSWKLLFEKQWAVDWHFQLQSRYCVMLTGWALDRKNLHVAAKTVKEQDAQITDLCNCAQILWILKHLKNITPAIVKWHLNHCHLCDF